MSSSPKVTHDIQDRVALVTINNPPMNALDVDTRQQLSEVFSNLENRLDDIGAVVLTGWGGKAFSSGADVKKLTQLDAHAARRYLKWSQSIYNQVDNFHWPVIGAVEGYCLGGGLELALCCDMRYLDEEAKLGFPEINLSLFPGNGGIKRALDHLSLGALKEMVYSGRMVSAHEAQAMGLAEKVLPNGQVLERALDLAREIAAKPPLGLASAKRVLNRTRDLSLEQYLELESDLWAGLTDTHDMQECARAFLEKRRPSLKGA